MDGKDINRLTEQKTGEDVNKRKLVTEKEESSAQDGENDVEEESKSKRPEQTERKKRNQNGL